MNKTNLTKEVKTYTNRYDGLNKLDVANEYLYLTYNIEYPLNYIKEYYSLIKDRHTYSQATTIIFKKMILNVVQGIDNKK